jgi:hypothetical protein
MNTYIMGDLIPTHQHCGPFHKEEHCDIIQLNKNVTFMKLNQEYELIKLAMHNLTHMSNEGDLIHMNH